MIPVSGWAPKFANFLSISVKSPPTGAGYAHSGLGRFKANRQEERINV